MFSPDESPGRRRNWAAAYVVLGVMGLSVLLPVFQPQSLSVGLELMIVWGSTMLLGYGFATYATIFGGTKNLWIENSGSWLGNAGLSIYVVTLIQSVIVEGSLGKAPQTLGYIALLVIMVSRSYRLQRQLRTTRRLKEIVRIANRNGTS